MQSLTPAESNLDQNLWRLKRWFSEYSSCIVAFSAGVDSSLLCYVARQALGEMAHAVTSVSPAFAESERQETKTIANEIGIDLIEVIQNDLGTPGYTKNEVTRCYFCRSNLALAIKPIAERLSVDVCVDGTHADDLKSPRPGVKALRENDFRAPLAELGFGKEQIRAMARHVGLSNWNRPSEACLSSRVAYGQIISLETLQRIEKAENFVRSITRAGTVRVRTIGTGAIVEVEKEKVCEAIKNSKRISKELENLGYQKVEIDPDGYASGKMLELFVKSMEK